MSRKVTEKQADVEKKSDVPTDRHATTPMTNEAPAAAAMTQVPPLKIDALASLKHILRGDDADAARDAAVALGNTADAAAVDALTEVLWNANGYYHAVVRAAAASALGQLRDLHGFEALLFAVRDPMAESSAEAIRALAQLGDTRAVDAILEVVRNPNNYFLNFVRSAAVQALAQLGGDSVRNELRLLANDQREDPHVREAAQEATNGKAF